jgi:surfactin synthase thioesterase subunit
MMTVPMKSPRSTPWAAAGGATASAGLRLFCLPFAGGGSAAYRGWRGRFGGDVDVIPITLPGREMRFAEPAYRALAPLVDAMADGLASLLDRPYALFGYSMGALIAHRLADRLAAGEAGEPAHLFAAAHRAPQLARRLEPIHDLPSDAFWHRLGQYNSMPSPVLENRELRDLLEPVLRADFAVVETAGPPPARRLSCPVTAIGGSLDRFVDAAALQAWAAVTTGSFECLTMAGGHFFINEVGDALIDAVVEALRPAAYPRSQERSGAEGADVS